MATPPHQIDSNMSLPFAVIGPYRLQARLGGGGMGSVYLAQHTHLQRLVALKLLAPRWHGNPVAVERFKQEMAAIGRVKHANIIGATDAGEERGCPYLVMEYVEGIDLGRLLRERGPFSVANACELARQTADALCCLVQHGLVHRDVKPTNLLLGQDGILRVLDLGLALLQETSPQREALTETGQVMGTGDFIAPEQGVASHDVDIRADIYSLGCTLYAMLAGQPPFAGPPFVNFYCKVRAHQETPVPPIRSRRAEVPAALADLLEGMLQKDPGQRIASPDEVAERLRPFAEGHAVGSLLTGNESMVEATTSSVVEARSPTVDQGNPKPQPDTVQSPSTRPVRLSWRRVCAGMLLLLVTGITLWAVLKKPPGTPSSPIRPEPDQPDPTQPATFEPGVWHELLARPPRELLWPKQASNSYYDHQPHKRELRVACADRGMLEFAQVADADFDLEMTFVQTPWVGGFGVFFRARKEKPIYATTIWADFLFLPRFDQGPENNPITLIRGQFERFRNEDKVFRTTLKTDLIPRPLQVEQPLSITVGSHGLQTILWRTDPVGQTLCDPQPTIPPRAGKGGGMGILVENSTVILRSVRLRVHPSSGDKP